MELIEIDREKGTRAHVTSVNETEGTSAIETRSRVGLCNNQK